MEDLLLLLGLAPLFELFKSMSSSKLLTYMVLFGTTAFALFFWFLFTQVGAQ